MDNPYAQHIDDSGSPEASSSQLPADIEGSEESWVEASSSGYETESDYYTAGDEEFWEEDNAAVRWLVRNPGGTSCLYPRLFIVKPRQGRIETQPRHPNRSSLLDLPSEIRNRIYAHCFEKSEEHEGREHAGEGYAAFRDREGHELDRILLTSENQELRFCLSTALLQTSRQVRSEAMPIFFSRRVVTVEWLPALPRLVEFLGREGCGMVRYLDIWDFLNLQEHNNTVYQEFIASVVHFLGLQHLRIVLSWGTLHGEFWTDRIHSWFDSNEWTDSGALVERAVPKIKPEHIESHWQEYDLLKSLKAQKFTLAVQVDDVDKYLEFDRNQGVYSQLAMAMRPGIIPGPSTQSLPSSAASIPPQVLEALEDITISADGTIFTPVSRSDDEDSDGPSWRDTDDLVSKKIPMYNYLREFFHVKILPDLPQADVLATFAAFPTARKSKGSIMRDCDLCYLRDGHCGYHAVPDQPPFIIDLETASTWEREESTSEARFRDMSYLDMRDACRHVVIWIADNYQNELARVFEMSEYIGWYELPNTEVLERLDAAVDAGWTGQRFDKQEVPPWDVLYRELLLRISMARTRRFYQPR